MDESTYIDPVKKNLLTIESIKKEILRGLSILLLVSLVFLFLRIMLRLFGANPETAFAGFIFLISGIFLLPFFGIFPRMSDRIVAGQMTIDASALVAFFCYLILILLAMSVTQIVANILKTEKQKDATVKKSHPIDTSIVDQSIE
jgi:hypothetical protein